MNGDDAPWMQILAEATERVQLSVSAIALGGDRGVVVGTGASGDKTLLADKEAEDELLRALSKVGSLRVLSEEAGSRGNPKAKHVAVVDPVDGSSNLERGIPFYCTSVAIAAGKTLKGVSVALVRNLVNGDVYFAERGKGATKNGRRIHTSSKTKISESVVGIDMSRTTLEIATSLAPLVTGARRQVHFGSNALELCYLAEGRTDALVDVRGLMRVTDFAGAYLIAEEAGAEITSERGGLLDPGLDLSTRFSFVASANPSIHKEILKLMGVTGSS